MKGCSKWVQVPFILVLNLKILTKPKDEKCDCKAMEGNTGEAELGEQKNPGKGIIVSNIWVAVMLFMIPSVRKLISTCKSER